MTSLFTLGVFNTYNRSRANNSFPATKNNAPANTSDTNGSRLKENCEIGETSKSFPAFGWHAAVSLRRLAKCSRDN